VKFIAVTGIIGAGKSSVAQALSELSGFPLVKEAFGENPFLASYYDNPEKYAAQMQMWFLLRRLEQLDFLERGQVYVVDQPLGAFGFVFPKMQNHAGYLDSTITRSIISLYKEFERALEYSQYCVLLDVSIDMALERIKQRGREMEKSINDEYLMSLQRQYYDFIEHLDGNFQGITVSNNNDSSPRETAEAILALYNKGICESPVQTF